MLVMMVLLPLALGDLTVDAIRNDFKQRKDKGNISSYFCVFHARKGSFVLFRTVYLHLCLGTIWVPGAPGVHKRQPHLLGLELRITVCLLEIELGSCIRAADTLSHWAVSPGLAGCLRFPFVIFIGKLSRSYLCRYLVVYMGKESKVVIKVFNSFWF